MPTIKILKNQKASGLSVVDVKERRQYPVQNQSQGKLKKFQVQASRKSLSARARRNTNTLRLIKRDHAALAKRNLVNLVIKTKALDMKRRRSGRQGHEA